MTDAVPRATDAQIRRFQREAKHVGDLITAGVCALALDGDSAAGDLVDAAIADALDGRSEGRLADIFLIFEAMRDSMDAMRSMSDEDAAELASLLRRIRGARDLSGCEPRSMLDEHTAELLRRIRGAR